MRNKIIGNIALACSPVMMIGMSLEEKIGPWFTGLWGLVYMTTWTAMLIVLRDAAIVRKNSFARSLVLVLIASLAIANVSNLVNLFEAANSISFFFYLDLFWPISHSLMFILGLTVLIQNSFTGWKKFVPLIFGSWFPASMILMTVAGRQPLVFYSMEIFNFIGFALMALLVRSIPDIKTGDTEKQLIIIQQ
jgi:hypothetical protein